MMNVEHQLFENIGHDEIVCFSRDEHGLKIVRTRQVDGGVVQSVRILDSWHQSLANVDIVGLTLWEMAQEVRSTDKVETEDDS